MKTFEEAMKVFAYRVRPGEEILPLLADIPGTPEQNDLRQKYLDLLEPIGESREAIQLAEQTLARLTLGHICCAKHMLIEMFLHGIRCGIEMEKP